jgi:hypothetical protein
MKIKRIIAALMATLLLSGVLPAPVLQRSALAASATGDTLPMCRI